MPELIRCFIAIKIPDFDPLRRVLKELAQMGRPLKAVDPSNLHVTLKFLGDTDLDLIGEIGSLVEQVAQPRQPCVVKVAGLGVFPHLERPNVVWAGLAGAEALTEIAADLETGLEEFGFARENRPFVPHLTLARVKARPPEALRPLLSRHAKTDFGIATIDQIELIRSELGPEGSKYTVLASARLGAGMTEK
jgi:RNA 2',3'-cyclic 3'-phosphodiesterase